MEETQKSFGQKRIKLVKLNGPASRTMFVEGIENSSNVNMFISFMSADDDFKDIDDVHKENISSIGSSFYSIKNKDDIDKTKLSIDTIVVSRLHNNMSHSMEAIREGFSNIILSLSEDHVQVNNILMLSSDFDSLTEALNAAFIIENSTEYVNVKNNPSIYLLIQDEKEYKLPELSYTVKKKDKKKKNKKK